MNAKVMLYDATNIDQFSWPNTDEGNAAKKYLYPLIKEGASPFLLNVNTKIYLVSFGQTFFPITINEKEYENSYIASNYYALKLYQEVISNQHPLLQFLQKPLIFLGSQVLKGLKINKTIFLNNWLMTNSVSAQINISDLSQILDFLKIKFSKHIIIFRHIDTITKKDLFQTLTKSDFHLLKTRDIFFYNPLNKLPQNKAVRRQIRQDLNVIDKYNFSIVTHDEINESDYERILELYQMLYINKYSKYSPHYTKKYLEITHKNNMVNYTLLKKDGIIEGFFSYFIYNKVMMSCIFGYDTTKSYSHEVYQLLTRLVIEKAEKLGVIVNDGSGGDAAKTLRGMISSSEYMGLYTAHLPLPRRLIWNSIAFFYNKFVS